MTWSSHRVITFVSVVLFTQDVWKASVAMLGSTFPDRVERWLPGSWQKHHRKASHWFLLYLLVLSCLYVCPVCNEFQRNLVGFSRWYVFGCLAHIVEDSVCGRIPLFSPGKPRWVCPRLFYTGGRGESVFVFVYVVFVGVFWLFRLNLI